MCPVTMATTKQRNGDALAWRHPWDEGATGCPSRCNHIQRTHNRISARRSLHSTSSVKKRASKSGGSDSCTGGRSTRKTSAARLGRCRRPHKSSSWIRRLSCWWACRRSWRGCQRPGPSTRRSSCCSRHTWPRPKTPRRNRPGSVARVVVDGHKCPCPARIQAYVPLKFESQLQRS